VGVLRVGCRSGGGGCLVVEVVLEGAGVRRVARGEFGWGLSERDREDVRWYLEDFLQYPVDPAPEVARRVEARLGVLGRELFAGVFEGSRDGVRLWDAVGVLPGVRVEVEAEPGEAAGVPWELLRDPASDGVVALRAGRSCGRCRGRPGRWWCRRRRIGCGCCW
jgi:hypothetical protein